MGGKFKIENHLDGGEPWLRHRLWVEVSGFSRWRAVCAIGETESCSGGHGIFGYALKNGLKSDGTKKAVLAVNRRYHYSQDAAIAVKLSSRSDNDRVRPVSIVAVAVVPARNVGASGLLMSLRRTGRRCTTLTQFPDAFCGGKIANSAPVAGEMLCTSAFHV